MRERDGEPGKCMGMGHDMCEGERTQGRGSDKLFQLELVTSGIFFKYDDECDVSGD